MFNSVEFAVKGAEKLWLPHAWPVSSALTPVVSVRQPFQRRPRTSFLRACLIQSLYGRVADVDFGK